MKLYAGLYHTIIIAMMFLGGQFNTGQAQNCFGINTPLSKIVLEPGPVAKLPNEKDSVTVSCTQSIVNFNFVLDFIAGTEPYFEDVTQLVGTLSYKSSTIILKYDKTNNTFSIPDNQNNLRAGEYKLNISAMNCTPVTLLCNNCSIDYTFSIAYDSDVVLFVDIVPDPNPAVLTCYSGSLVKLTATSPPSNDFAAQWSVLQNNQFEDIPGATSHMYTASQAGTYRYFLTGPAGCTGSDIIAVNPPQMPEVYIQPDTQVLQACEQKIIGVTAKYFGSANNLEYTWTTNSSGILISGANTPSPIVGAPGIYTVTIQRIDNGCTASTFVTTVPGAIPVVHAKIDRDPGTGRLDCWLKEIKLLATASQTPISSTFKYEWSNGVIGPDIIVLDPGLYTVTATSAQSGCKGAATLLVTQDITIPAIQIQSPRDTICANESITLSALTQEPCSYLWSNNSTNNMNTVAPLVNGPNQYVVTVTANDNGCTNTAVKWIVQVDAPIVFCQQDALVLQNGEQASLNCSTTGNQLRWVATVINVRDLSVAGDGPINGQFFYLDNIQAPGSVQYAFYGKNPGCTSKRVDVQVTVLPNSEEGIFIPELVTPNGDGLHDSWDIVLPESITNPAAYQILLFNRYGAQVYQGTLANTIRLDEMPDGSYYYAISTPDGGKIRGAVTVLRRQ